jgi:hypothetical protein
MKKNAFKILIAAVIYLFDGYWWNDSIWCSHVRVFRTLYEVRMDGTAAELLASGMPRFQWISPALPVIFFFLTNRTRQCVFRWYSGKNTRLWSWEITGRKLKRKIKRNPPGWIGTSTRVTAQSTHWPVGLGHHPDRGRSTHNDDREDKAQLQLHPTDHT